MYDSLVRSYVTVSKSWLNVAHILNDFVFLSQSASRNLIIELKLDGYAASAAYATLKSNDPLRGQCQAGSLTGAVHLLKNNAGVLRLAQRGQKPLVE